MYRSTPVGGQDAAGLDLDGVEEGFARRRPGDEAAHRGGIAADVENAATAEFLVVGPRLGIEGRVIAKRRAHQQHLADGTRPNQLDHCGDLRVAAVHERLHQEDVVRPRRLDHLRRVAGVHPDRLLYQHVLARLRRRRHHIAMGRMDGRHVDDVDVVVGEQVGVALVPRLAAEQVGQRIGPARAAAGDGRQAPRFRELQAIAKDLGDAACADDSPVDHDASPCRHYRWLGAGPWRRFARERPIGAGCDRGAAVEQRQVR